jgi:ABC-2 type transport system permease protein
MNSPRFALTRLLAMMVKEFIQMKRDRLTFAMLVGIPVIQLTLFGFAINADPKHLPTAVRLAETSPFSRTLLSALENSGYFSIVTVTESEAEVDRLLERGEVQFVVTVPAGFARALQRGDRPTLLVEADATDPAATGNAVAALAAIGRDGLKHELAGALAPLAPGPPAFELLIHRRYNPEGITQYNVVPGLVGVILTMTMVLMTSLAVTRERERGTMENLLALPIRPTEVMLGKILPFIAVGFTQVVLVVTAARVLFGVPMLGSFGTLLVALLVFISANLSVGFLFSTLAKNQLQAMQMTFFFFLPSILLSGFMFPFRGMPRWAQVIGEILPLTHFLRIIRGIMLKGNGLAEAWPNLWPLLLFVALVATLAVNRYRQTLD